ncbi:hypothetical protein M569_11211 [Genlisea aurea]|uniref:Polygalacturonase n=1 Tax=Genlisea aurea TaxID=192259 RepID=S8DL41_9LAMI|nr:hypothetical protein M569_11211 [Genlisea aurea]
MTPRFIFLLCFFAAGALSQRLIVSVTDYGAVADGRTDNQRAFLSAWRDACNSGGGGMVHVPRGGNYYVSQAVFEGPCRGEMSFRHEGYIIASSEYSGGDSWISFRLVNRLSISGSGTFDGNGASTWNRCRSSGCNFPPSSLKLDHVKDVSVKKIISVNSKAFHINIDKSRNVFIDGLTVIAPGDSPNTDGVHIGKSSYITVTNSRISTGDDCVSVGDGNSHVNISSIHCGPGHGISIGSLGRYGYEKDVHDISVSNCDLVETTNGLRIKTWAPSAVATTVSNVTFSDIRVKRVRNPVLIDQHYCPSDSCSHGDESMVQIRDVKFVGVRGSSADRVGVTIECSKDRPCQGIEFVGLHLTMEQGQSTMAYCSNANGQFVGRDQIPARCLRAMEKAVRKVGSLKSGTFWVSKKAKEEMSNISQDLTTLSNTVEEKAKWIFNKLKGKPAKSLSDLLLDHNLPPGLFPRNATSYDLDEARNKLVVYLPSPCEVCFSDSSSSVVRYSNRVKLTLGRGSLSDIQGMKTKVLAVWVTVTSIHVEGTKSSDKVWFAAAGAAVKKARPRDAFEIPRDGLRVDKF